jgi:hypothetical protein
MRRFNERRPTSDGARQEEAEIVRKKFTLKPISENQSVRNGLE